MPYSCTAYYTRCICILLLHFCDRHVDSNCARRPTVCVCVGASGADYLACDACQNGEIFQFLSREAQEWQSVANARCRQVETPARLQNDGADTTVQLGVYGVAPAWTPPTKFIYSTRFAHTIRFLQLVFVSAWCVGVSVPCTHASAHVWINE